MCEDSSLTQRKQNRLFENPKPPPTSYHMLASGDVRGVMQDACFAQHYTSSLLAHRRACREPRNGTFRNKAGGAEPGPPGQVSHGNLDIPGLPAVLVRVWSSLAIVGRFHAWTLGKRVLWCRLGFLSDRLNVGLMEHGPMPLSSS